MFSILVTGGQGLVGVQFKGKQFIKPSSKEVDLTLTNSLDLYFNNKPKVDAIIHLAAKVGGVKANTDFVSDFTETNLKINQNVLKYAHTNCVSKLVSLMSTCVYPDENYVNYPLTEDQLHLGPPHYSNFGYAYAKRMLDVQSRAYRQQYKCNFITAIPNNLYGENDNFDLENSHVIPAIMRKIWEAKINNKSYVEIWGDGSPLREFTYSGDIKNILLFLLENYNEPDPINIGNTCEISIKDVVEKIKNEFEYDGKIFWNTQKPKGQFRKPSSNKKLLELGWKEKNYTSFEEGIKITCDWFKNSYPRVRGV